MGFIEVSDTFFDKNPGRYCGILMFLLATGCAQAATDFCQNHEISVSTAPAQSRLQEQDRTGETLLTERGHLAKTGATWYANCGSWALQFEGSNTTGQRLYKGVTNLKQAVETTSGIRSEELDGQLWHSLGQSWALGGRYMWRTTVRDLKSVGSALGYLERYNQTALAWGLQHTWDLANHGRVQSRIWMGSSLQGNLHVTLPNMDAAIIPLGRMRWWAIGAQWSGCRTGIGEKGWGCEIAIDYKSERSSHSSTQAIYSNGVLRASASQPATNQQSLTFKLGALYRFH